MATLSRQGRQGGLLQGWPEFCEWVTSTENRIYFITIATGSSATATVYVTAYKELS